MEDDHSNHTVYIYPDEYEMNGKQLLKTNHPYINTPVEAVEYWTKDDPKHPFIGERAFLPD